LQLRTILVYFAGYWQAAARREPTFAKIQWLREAVCGNCDEHSDEAISRREPQARECLGALAMTGVAMEGA
jgi:hypothetical protein